MANPAGTVSTLAEALAAVAPEHPLADRVEITEAPPSVLPQLAPEPDCVRAETTVHGPGAAGAPWLELTVDVPELIVSTMRGGRWESTYPVEAFAPRPRLVHPRHLPDRGLRQTAAGFGVETFGSLGGRSSDGDMPYFLLEDPRDGRGLWVAVGWSGDWRASVQRMDASGRFVVRVDSPNAALDLASGETLTLPPVYVGLYDGDGWAAFRRFLGRRARRSGGPWVVYDTWFNEEIRMTDARLQEHVAVAREVGVEVFVVDAGWYETGSHPDDEGSDWYAATGSGVDHVGIGTWAPDPARFPHGLESIADAARGAGLKFGLWFEPERAHARSWVATERPSWVRESPESQFRLVDFGHPEARAWALETMSEAVARLGVEWMRWDMNFKSARVFWQADPRLEIGHVRGVWHVMDELKRRHPQLILEGCASGGNRLDAEMLRRSDTYWMSDSVGSPDVVRGQIGNARRLLPAQYCGVSFTPHVGPLEDWPDEWWIAPLSGTPVIMDRLSAWTPALRQRAARHIAAFKRFRHLLDTDYRRLADDAAQPLRGWDAWEFSDGVTGEAVLMAFRLRSDEPSRRFDGERSWEVELPVEGATAIHAVPGDES